MQLKNLMDIEFNARIIQKNHERYTKGQHQSIGEDGKNMDGKFICTYYSIHLLQKLQNKTQKRNNIQM